MAFLLPVSSDQVKSSRRLKLNPQIIQIKRSVNHHRKWRIVRNKIRDVCRVHPKIDLGGLEYFTLLREHIPVCNYYCKTLNRLVDINHCLTFCRFQNKTRCDIFMHGYWACLSCPHGNRYETCTKIKSCIDRLHIIDWVSLYFSELMKLSHIVYRMRYGVIGRKKFPGKNTKPQLYLSAGWIDPSGRRANTPRGQSATSRISRARQRKRIKFMRKYRAKHGGTP